MILHCHSILRISYLESFNHELIQRTGTRFSIITDLKTWKNTARKNSSSYCRASIVDSVMYVSNYINIRATFSQQPRKHAISRVFVSPLRFSSYCKVLFI